MRTPADTLRRAGALLVALKVPALASGCAAALCACSLAGNIQRNALEYNASVANYNDQMLLYTILRARDEAPINILALSTINGAISLQESLGASTGYENISGFGGAHDFTGALTPGVQATSSPTWSMASLDTQGFMLGIIQPISPMYVVSKWSTGIDREFLLRLFVKSIQVKEARGYHEYLNDPNSPAAMAEFAARLHAWFPKISMRALTVLEPLGPAFDPSTVTTTSTTWDNTRRPAIESRIEKTEAANAGNAALIGAYEYLVPLSAGPFHVGNAPPASAGGGQKLQLYREYPQQVVLCVPRSTLGPELVSSSSAPMGEVDQEEENAMSSYALALKSAAKGGAGRLSQAPPAAPGASTGAPGLGQTPHTPPASPTSLSSNLKIDRVAAILPLGACGQDELVLPAYTEEENARNSGSYSHVEWRSISEVIQYLGALLRSHDPDALRWTSADAHGEVTTHTLFALSSTARAGFARVQYRGITYAVQTDADGEGAPGTRNHSMQALMLLNELISTAKVSSDIPNTQSIQIVP
jgi:hypothetical protein